MIKTKAFSTFIVCSILISGISNSYIFGMNEEEKMASTSSSNDDDNNDEQLIEPNKKPWCSLSTRKNACRLFVALLVTAGIGLIGVEIIGSGSSTPNPTNTPEPSFAIQTCPHLIPLNGEFSCSSEEYQYWPGVHAAEVYHSGVCLPDCFGSPNIRQNSFKAPKRFVCNQNSPQLKKLLKKMEGKGIIYHCNHASYPLWDYIHCLYDSDSGSLEIPKPYFTVDEFENDSKAMKIIEEYFEYENYFNRKTTCPKFVLGE